MGKVPEVSTTHQGALGRAGAPWWIVLTSVAFLFISYFANFCNIPKLTENIFMEFLESVYLSYHIPTAFSGFWSVPEDYLDVFFRCDDLDDICFFVNGGT